MESASHTTLQMLEYRCHMPPNFPISLFQALHLFIIGHAFQAAQHARSYARAGLRGQSWLQRPRWAGSSAPDGLCSSTPGGLWSSIPGGLAPVPQVGSAPASEQDNGTIVTLVIDTVFLLIQLKIILAIFGSHDPFWAPNKRMVM